MSRRASAALPGSSWNPSNTAHTGPSSPRSSAADSRSNAYSGESSSAHHTACRLSLLASVSVASGNRALLRTVRVSRMRWFGYPVPGQRLGFEPSALEDALAETLAWYRVAKPSHPGYANRPQELAI